MTKLIASAVFAAVIIFLTWSVEDAYQKWCGLQVKNTKAVMSGEIAAPDAITQQDERDLESMIEKTREDSDAMDAAVAEGDYASGLEVLYESERDFYQNGSFARNVAINAKQLGGGRFGLIDQIKTSGWASSIARNVIRSYAVWCIALALVALLTMIFKGNAAFDAIQYIMVVVGIAIPLATAVAGLVLAGPWGTVATLFSMLIGLLCGLVALIVPAAIAINPEQQ